MKHILEFEEFINESTTDGTIESLIDATKIATKMGVFTDDLLKEVKQNFISGARASLKTEKSKLPSDKRNEYQKLMDSLIDPLEKANSMSKFIKALQIISVTKNNILDRLGVDESLVESKILTWFKDAKKQSADWWKENIAMIIEKISKVLLSLINNISDKIVQNL